MSSGLYNNILGWCQKKVIYSKKVKITKTSYSTLLYTAHSVSLSRKGRAGKYVRERETENRDLAVTQESFLAQKTVVTSTDGREERSFSKIRRTAQSSTAFPTDTHTHTHTLYTDCTHTHTHTHTLGKEPFCHTDMQADWGGSHSNVAVTQTIVTPQDWLLPSSLSSYPSPFPSPVLPTGLYLISHSILYLIIHRGQDTCSSRPQSGLVYI
ncbi:hypothetical protein J4Q44_G00179470 [Coregonus suidteri]|uniref:Uncharacterized protein n=1 Tax=Coregonus suidteri TaxID=861788 RepID=A0AAN8LGL1_9TELE